MKERTIKLLGEDIKIKICMAVICYYERAQKKAFTIEDLADNYNCMVLYAAIIEVLNPDTKITFDMLMRDANAKEIEALREATTESLKEFYPQDDTFIPQQPQPSFEESQGEQPEDAKPKN